MEHERERFQSMTPKQLEMRLGRIKKAEKLAKFAAVALEFAERFQNQSERYLDLSKRAKAKLNGDLYPGHQYQIDFSAICRGGTILLLIAVLWLFPAVVLAVCPKANISIRSETFVGNASFLSMSQD
jgi:hypothetical protein